MVSSWKLLTSATVNVDSVVDSASEISGVPILPPTTVEIPAHFRMCAISEVVVVLPFEPVMAMRRPRRKRQASSISLQTGIPFERAAASSCEIGGDAGA